MVATRASDADRDSCLDDIQAAFADGRINDAEREARTQAALQATTLSELAELVSDLGPAARLPSKVAASLSPAAAVTSVISRRLLRALLIATLIPAVIAVVVWISTANGDDDPATPGSVSQESIPKRLELHTAAGFEKLVALTKAKFGTTIVDSVAIYPDYASVEVVEKEDPRRVQRWYFAKGYEGEPSKGTRTADAVTVDLTAIDVAAYVKAIKRAPAVLGVEDVIRTYVVIGASSGEPTFSVYVSNEYSESGYWSFTLQGEEVYRYAFE